MSSIKIKSAIKIDLAEVLDGVAHLDTPDLEKFLIEVANLLAQRKGKILPKREAELLVKINQRLLDKDTQETYDRLYKKLQEETISPQEHERLLKLIRKRETKGVERVACLVELSQLRKEPLKEVMKQLGIDSIADAA